MPETGAVRKRERDRTRKRAGAIQRKREHVLNNPNKLAFKGWWDVPDPWKYSTCEEYIEWCHITKLFPLERHHFHRHSEKANLTHCRNQDFVQRCIEVFQHLYNLPILKRNEAPLFICRMVYAEVILHKVVDWTTIKSTPRITVPTEPQIPREKKFPDGGLGRIIKAGRNEVEKVHETEESDPDSDSDGTRFPRAKRRPIVRRGAPNVAPTLVVENMDPAEDNEWVPVPTEVIGDPGVSMEVLGVPVVGQRDETDEMSMMRGVLLEKDDFIAQLQATIQSLKLEVTTKDIQISRLQNQLQQRQPMEHVEVRETVAVHDPTEVDENYLNNVVDIATAGVLQEIRTPAKRQRPPVILPPLGPFVQPYVDIDGALSEDSLSFPRNIQTDEVNELRKANDELRLRLSKMSESYYQWKVATILTVDRGCQIANEFKRIDNEYLEHNTRRDFGLTSWISSDEMFPSDLPVTAGEPSLIDWAKLDFDHENARSSHDLQLKEGVTSRQLWPQPAPWMFDGTKCVMCYNPFGPEGGWALGSCKHMFHPMCLISIFLVRRFCPSCRAPFHARLYEVFGLTSYMPPSHERDPINTPGEGYRPQWGEDLIWSWRAQTHSVFKNDISLSFGWEHDHTEIVRVCHKIIGSAPQDEGKRNFFYQTMDGYWNSDKKIFQFGKHPKGFMWNRNGELVTDKRGHASMTALEAVQMDLSEWKETWRSEAVDFLLDEHSPSTLRCLEELRNSQMLRNLSEVDGPFRRTRTRARRSLMLSDEAGPSGTTGGNEDE